MKLLYTFCLITILCYNTSAQTPAEKQCVLLHCTPAGVGIGTEVVPVGYMLAVNGKMLMETGQIEVASKWPDYVFEKGYNFLEMPQLKKYIAANGHLPNMPTAAAVKREGIDVAEMNVLLLQKIEELSLYIIKMQDRLNVLRQQQEQLQPNKQVK